MNEMAPQKKGKRVLLTGGGTGGHVFPLVAVVQEMERQQLDVSFSWAGRENGMEAEIAKRYQWPYFPISSAPYRRNEILNLPRTLFRNLKGIISARRLLRRERFDLVIGSGGYVSLPVYLASWLSSIPFFIIESNSVAGLANRLCAGFAKAVFVAYDRAARRLRAGKTVVIKGNPVRSEFTDASVNDTASPEKLLLIVGGSQGAESLNRFMQAYVPGFLETHPEWQVIHIAGKPAAELEKQMGPIPRLRIVSFLDDLPDVMRRAALVISRAGAMSLAEISYCGLPAILVPFPHATGDHQYYNAMALAEEGCAVVVREEGAMTGVLEKIDAALNDLSGDERLTAMRETTRARAGYNPAVPIVERIRQEIF